MDLRSLANHYQGPVGRVLDRAADEIDALDAVDALLEALRPYFTEEADTIHMSALVGTDDKTMAEMIGRAVAARDASRSRA